MSGELMRRKKQAARRIARCPLHGAPLERRIRRFVDPASIAGRRTAFQQAERDVFPFAGVYIMCRNGPFAGASCPQCRVALRAWCESRTGDGPQEEILKALEE